MQPYGIDKVFVSQNGSFSLPKKLYDRCETDALYITIGAYQCLNIYTDQLWQKFIGKLEEQAERNRRILRPIFASAMKVDRGDRIRPAFLLNHAYIRNDDYAVLAGGVDRIELMDLLTYKQEYLPGIAVHLTEEQKTAAYYLDSDTIESVHGNREQPLSGVFICHSSADKKFARRVVADLILGGAAPWIDACEIRPGDSIIGRIQSGIDACGTFVIILSPNSVASPWCRNELYMALTNQIQSGDVKIIPVKYRACEIPGFLRDKRYIDMTDSRGYSAGIQALLAAL